MTKKTSSSNPSIFFRLIIGVFIILCLGLQAAVNLEPVLTKISGAQSADNNKWSARQAINLGAKALGLGSSWRAFADPEKHDWHYSIWAVYQTPKWRQEWIPLPNQKKNRNFFERNLLDFRELKFQQNIFENSTMLNILSQHLCSELGRYAEAPEAIRIVMTSREILPKTKVLEEGRDYGPKAHREFGLYSCTPPSEQTTNVYQDAKGI